MLLAACQTPHFALHGITNLRSVDSSKNIWRGGEPSDEGWACLSSIGITNIVKLNPSTEANDLAGEKLGLAVYYSPITFPEQMGVGKLWHHQVFRAAEHIQPNTFVHCTHGEDRTGLVCAVYRVRWQSWPKAKAEEEMLQNGFHKELYGLWHFWQEFNP